ncbi:MAG: hypothetical protein ACKVIN_01455 [Longimicrobiales bacterium]
MVITAGACRPPEETVPDRSEEAGQPADSSNSPVRTYERNIVFASTEGDSVFIVPWMIQTVELAASVRREARGWLTRGGVWDGFLAERWTTPPTRTPARILPHEGLRLLVRDGGAIDGIVFEEGVRNLEIILGEVRTAWTGARGGSFEVLTGSAYLSDQRIDGMVLDMARASGASESPGGDWAFLLSGDSAQFVFAADREHGGEVEPLYRGWGRGDSEFQWPEVRVDWRRTEAFPPARRDVPVEWRFWTSDEAFEGDLEVVSAEMQPGLGPGPLLPVRALYEVIGEVRTSAGTYPVHGILVHERR